MRARLLTMFALAAAFAAPAAAQPADRGYISFNGLVQAADNGFTDRFEFDRYLEKGTTEARYPIEQAMAFDGGIGVRLWKRLGAGVTVSRYERDASVPTDTSVPHPFFDARLRSFSGDAPGLARTETGVHAHATYLIGGEGAVRALLFAGPSHVTVEQDLVTRVEYEDVYPYDTAAFLRADTEHLRASAVTFNVGADVTWMFARHLGVGGLLRFARATVDLRSRDGRTIGVDAGGLTGGAGVRIAF